MTSSQYVSGRTVQEQMCELMKLVTAVDGKQVSDVSATQNGNLVTVTVTLEDGTEKSFTFSAVMGVSIDTDQTITGKKVFSAETQMSSDLDVGGDFSVNGETVLGDEMEVAGAAFERSGNDLVVSPTNRLIVKTGAGANQEMVVGTDSVIVDTLMESTTPSADADVKTAANIEYVSSTDGRNNLVHTNGDESKNGVFTVMKSTQYALPVVLNNPVIDRSTWISARQECGIAITGQNNVALARLVFAQTTSGLRSVFVRIYDSGGSYHDTPLASYQES